jgi:hypothetical protein
MNQPALTEAVKTDLTSPKQNRRRRLALRFAVLVVAVSALGAAYWFTRPPELVWYISPTLDPKGTRLEFRLPRGWRLDRIDLGTAEERHSMLMFNALPSMPRIPLSVRRWLHVEEPIAQLIIHWDYSGLGMEDFDEVADSGRETGRFSALRSRRVSQTESWLISYNRGNRTAFRATWAAIFRTVKVKRAAAEGPRMVR